MKAPKMIGAVRRPKLARGGFTTELTNRRAGAALPARKAGKRAPLHTAVAASFDAWVEARATPNGRTTPNPA